MEIVLPIIERDLDYFENFRKSLRRFSHPFTKINLIVEDRLVDDMSRKYKECSVVPETTIYPHKGKYKYSNWHYQQVLKILAAEFVSTPHYLVMDSDVILLKNICLSDLVVDGKSKIARKKFPAGEYFSEDKIWRDWSARVLDSQPTEFFYEVTPGIFNTQVVKDMIEFLGGRDEIVYKQPWTEFCLYGAYLEKMGILEKTHKEVPFINLGCWTPKDFDEYDINECARNKDCYFGLIQGWMRKPINEIQEKFKPVLGD